MEKLWKHYFNKTKFLIFAGLSCVQFIISCHFDKSLSKESSVKVLIDDNTSFKVSLKGEGADFYAQRATGTIFAPMSDKRFANTEIRGTCGITFIAPHYGITAGHCVADFGLPIGEYTVQMYRFPENLHWQVATEITGKYPDIQHAKIPDYEKYIDRFKCKLLMRCGSAYDLNGSPVNCDNPKHSSADIALLRCDQSVVSRGYSTLKVAKADNPCAVPHLRWTHEVYQVQSPHSSEKYQDFLNHYINIDNGRADNWHYWGKKNGEEFNQLLPLVASEFGTANHSKLPPRNGENSLLTWTDIRSCHGASGSGFLQLNSSTNSFELLGPLSKATQSPGRVPKLCSGHSSAYTSLMHTQFVASFADDCKWPKNAFENHKCTSWPSR